MCDYNKKLTEIIDGIRDDFSVLGTFAFTGQGNVFDVNERFWKVYDAALQAKPLVEERMAEKGLQTATSVPWGEIDGFRAILKQAGPPAMMANAGLFGRYTMQLNQFFIFAQGLW